MTAGETLKPTGNRYHVRLREAPETTPGGIYLPDNWRENWTDGVVLAVGPGLPWEPAFTANSDVNAVKGPVNGWFRSPMWAQVGDVVLFRKEHWKAFPGEANTGSVQDDQLVGLIPDGVGEFEPLNDWVQIRQDPAIERDGAIELPEEYYPKPMSGVVEAFGPGKLRLAGDYYGTRRSVGDIMGRDDRQVCGERVYWTDTCEALACGRDHLEFLLIQADDLWGIEVPEGGGA